MMRAIAATLFTPPLLALVGILAGIDLLGRDPCDGWERKPGCAERETAGDRWSRDQARAREQASVPRNVAEDILDQVELPRDPIKLAEITPNGNLVVVGRAELLVVFCDDEKIAYVADLAGGFSYARNAKDGEDPDEIASAVGVRCSATLLANKDRPVGSAFGGCRTILCFADDALFRAYNPPED